MRNSSEQQQQRQGQPFERILYCTVRRYRDDIGFIVVEVPDLVESRKWMKAYRPDCAKKSARSAAV